MAISHGRIALIAVCFSLSVLILLVTRPSISARIHETYSYSPVPIEPSRPPPDFASLPAAIDEAQCRGPRGGLIENGRGEDLPQPITTLRLSNGSIVAYPEPTYGDYETVGLEKTWMTFEQRYGPYGYGEDSVDYNYTRADWSTVNWGKLQDDCYLAGPYRGSKDQIRQALQSEAPPRFRLDEPLGGDDTVRATADNTGRRAIVFRAWEGFEYAPEDMWNIRSVITEAALASKGKYTVFLLVDVKREDGARIHEEDDYYREVLEESVPKEFWDIAVLFHKSLQMSWYPKANEYKALWQIMQPLQLFAHVFPAYDHYWQVEMDTRFTGDVGKILDAFNKFGEDEPYKQSRERASWSFFPQIHGSWQNLSRQVNETLKGGATVWGAVDPGIDGFEPIQKPAVENPEDENFELGVGEDADVLIYNPLSDVLRFDRFEDWVFKDWHPGLPKETPRFMTVPAQARASRRLLEAIHQMQHERQANVPGEATLPTHALWNGLQVVQVPMPKYAHPARPPMELHLMHNGGDPRDFKDGISEGPAPYKSSALKWYARMKTWEWQSSLNDPLFEWWINDQSDEGRSLLKRSWAALGPVPDEMPPFLKEVDGKVYAPAFMMHPRKTNRNKET